MYVRDDFYRTELNEWPAVTDSANQVGFLSRNWNILLVSNVGDGGDATLLRSLVLKNLPRHVIRASNPAQAKSYLANAVFNAIVVCLEPTATSGLEACRELSTAHPEIPILLLTRDLDDELLGRCVVSGGRIAWRMTMRFAAICDAQFVCRSIA